MTLLLSFPHSSDDQTVSDFTQKCKDKKWIVSTLLLEKNYARINVSS